MKAGIPVVVAVSLSARASARGVGGRRADGTGNDRRLKPAPTKTGVGGRRTDGTGNDRRLKPAPTKTGVGGRRTDGTGNDRRLKPAPTKTGSRRRKCPAPPNIEAGIPVVVAVSLSARASARGVGGRRADGTGNDRRLKPAPTKTGVGGRRTDGTGNDRRLKPAPTKTGVGGRRADGTGNDRRLKPAPTKTGSRRRKCPAPPNIEAGIPVVVAVSLSARASVRGVGGRRANGMGNDRRLKPAPTKTGSGGRTCPAPTKTGSGWGDVSSVARLDGWERCAGAGGGPGSRMPASGSATDLATVTTQP